MGMDSTGHFPRDSSAIASGIGAGGRSNNEEGVMSAENEAVVRRFYEQMNNERKNELADELFTADHRMHDPQVPAAVGPDGMVGAVSTYQEGVDGHWAIEEIFSTGDRV